MDEDQDKVRGRSGGASKGGAGERNSSYLSSMVSLDQALLPLKICQSLANGVGGGACLGSFIFIKISLYQLVGICEWEKKKKR